MNLFDGVTLNWGFDAADIVSNGATLLGSLGGFVLLGLAVYFAPKLIDLVKNAAR